MRSRHLGQDICGPTEPFLPRPNRGDANRSECRPAPYVLEILHRIAGRGAFYISVLRAQQRRDEPSHLEQRVGACGPVFGEHIVLPMNPIVNLRARSVSTWVTRSATARSHSCSRTDPPRRERCDRLLLRRGARQVLADPQQFVGGSPASATVAVSDRVTPSPKPPMAGRVRTRSPRGPLRASA